MSSIDIYTCFVVVVFLRLIEEFYTRHCMTSAASWVWRCKSPLQLCTDIRWRCVVGSGLQRHNQTMLMATVPSGSCWIQTCHSQFVYGSGALDRVVLVRVLWVCLMRHGWFLLICSVWCPISFPKSLLPTPCWSFHESLSTLWLVDWLSLRKCGGIALSFVLACLLSWCWVARAGRWLQHGGIREGIVCFCGCQEVLSGWQLVAWRFVLTDAPGHQSKAVVQSCIESICAWALGHHTCSVMVTGMLCNLREGGNIPVW